MTTIATNLVIEAATRLGTLIDAHRRDVVRQLGDWLRSGLRDGETLPDFTLVLELPARQIGLARQRLRERTSELQKARSDTSEARFRRDQTASALRRKLVQIRRLLIAALGPQRTAKLLAIGGRTAQDSQPVLLLSQADAFLRLLCDPRRLVIAPAERFFDPAALVAEIESLATACRQACNQLDEIRHTTARRLAARDHARVDLDRAVQGCVHILSGWLLLIGRSDLVKKLHLIQRPSKATRPVARRGSRAGARPGKARKADSVPTLLASPPPSNRSEVDGPIKLTAEPHPSRTAVIEHQRSHPKTGTTGAPWRGATSRSRSGFRAFRHMTLSPKARFAW